MGAERGQMLSHYRLVEKISEGGMGVVWKAEDAVLTRTVAIKVLPADLALDEDRRRMFLDEARLAASVSHGNIVQVHELGREGDLDFIVMEYVEGQALSKLLHGRPLPPDKVANWGLQVAQGLARAHRKGLLHRDLKPANILVTPEGELKIVDFGLATLFSPPESTAGPWASTLTEGGPGETSTRIAGTLPYMSPEQVRGEKLDVRSDIFSLGTVLYEVTTGERPFTGRTQAEVAQEILRSPPKPAHELVPKIPLVLHQIIEKAMARAPEDRYQHMEDVAVDLKRLRKALESGSSPSYADLQHVARPRSRPHLARWAAAAACVLVIGAAAVWYSQRPDSVLQNPLEGATFTRLTDFEGSETDAAISRDGKFVAFRSDREGPVDTWISQIGSGRYTNLTHGTQNTVLVRNVGFTPDGSEIWLSGTIGGTRLRLMPLTGGTTRAFLTEHAMNVSWSPDGSRIVFQSYDTGDPMFVSDPTGANAQQIFTLGAGGHNHFPTWSSDGQWIYFISGIWDAKEMDVWRIRPSGGMPERMTQHSRDVRYLAPLDNRTMLYSSPDENGAGPWLWGLDTERKESRRISSGLESYTSVEASADGRRLILAVSNPTANLWRIPLLDRPTEERDVKPYSLPNVRAFAPRFRGESLFFLSSRGGGDGLWRYENGQSVEIWRSADGALFEAPMVSFDGGRVAVILRKQGKRTLHTLSADGGDVRPLAPAIDVASAGGWSPDGKWIAAAGIDPQGPGLFKIPVDGGEPVRLAQGLVSNPVWSPDGSLIAYMGPVVGVTGPLLLIRPDGTAVQVPAIAVRVGGERYRFVPGKKELIYQAGEMVSKQNLWLLDLTSQKTRLLSNFEGHFTRTFDITPDGKQIVFDRIRENSDIVLIDLPR